MNKKMIGIMGALIAVIVVGISFFTIMNKKEPVEYFVVNNGTTQKFDNFIVYYGDKKTVIDNSENASSHNIALGLKKKKVKIAVEVRNGETALGKSKEVMVDFTKTTPTTFMISDDGTGKVVVEVE